jgi:hypothetical protein
MEVMEMELLTAVVRPRSHQSASQEAISPTQTFASSVHPVKLIMTQTR